MSIISTIAAHPKATLFTVATGASILGLGGNQILASKRNEGFQDLGAVVTTMGIGGFGAALGLVSGVAALATLKAAGKGAGAAATAHHAAKLTGTAGAGVAVGSGVTLGVTALINNQSQPTPALVGINLGPVNPHTPRAA
ncbi:MAG: hypothetical protein JWO69_189 [Thermoleophilia bacterium]|jgi:hypothetical protein|nr:hypothetical protein [Thermoleophilia bacterium]